ALSGVATLECQRCMRPMQVPLDTVVRVGLIASEAQLGQVPADLEPVLAAGGRISIGELITEEMLLTLPIVPLHGEGEQCRAAPDHAGWFLSGPARAREARRDRGQGIDSRGPGTDPKACVLPIAIDVMSGDHEPREYVAGALRALSDDPQLRVQLVGEPQLITAALTTLPASVRERADVVAAS